MTGAKALRAWIVLVADKPEDISVKFVGSAFRHDVDDSAGRTAKLGQVRVGRDLIFLNGFLRDGRTCGVDRIVSKVGSVDLNEGRSSALAADIQSRGRSGADRAAVVAADGRDRQGKAGRTVRSLIGRLSIRGWSIVLATVVRLGSMSWTSSPETFTTALDCLRSRA